MAKNLLKVFADTQTIYWEIDDNLGELWSCINPNDKEQQNIAYLYNEVDNSFRELLNAISDYFEKHGGEVENDSENEKQD